MAHAVYDGESVPVTICLENGGLGCIRDIDLYIKDQRHVESSLVTDLAQGGTCRSFSINNCPIDLISRHVGMTGELYSSWRAITSRDTHDKCPRYLLVRR